MQLVDVEPGQSTWGLLSPMKVRRWLEDPSNASLAANARERLLRQFFLSGGMARSLQQLMEAREMMKGSDSPVSRFIDEAKKYGQFRRVIVALVRAMLEDDPLFLRKNAYDPTAETPFVSLLTVLRHCKEAGDDGGIDPLPSAHELESLCLDWEGKCLLDFHKEGNGDSPSTQAYTTVAFPSMLHVQLAFEFAMTGSEYLSLRERWAILHPTGR